MIGMCIVCMHVYNRTDMYVVYMYYLSGAACPMLIWPRLFYVLFVVSRIIILCRIVRDIWRKPNLCWTSSDRDTTAGATLDLLYRNDRMTERVVLDKWFPLRSPGPGGRGTQPFIYIYIYICGHAAGARRGAPDQVGDYNILMLWLVVMHGILT